ncbi:MAG TPA: DUF1353 domain-containing protein [Burkholderiales bacterium]|nr:DUF1353 domain-containing protein [Burkholderiales bacterium]
MRTIPSLTLLLCIVVPQPCSAVEYFGEFRDVLKGEFVEAKPRPKFKLGGEFRFADPNGLLWTVPPNQEVDGASIPQPFWSFIGGPFEGDYIKASVIHDYYCVMKTRTEHDTHRNFYYGMRAAGVSEWKAKFMYWAVVTFGPKWTLAPRVVQKLSCSTTGEKLTCSRVAETKMEVTPLPSVDLEDGDTLAAALSKASTVARSLKTSGGKVLDVTVSGQVAANLDDISKNASEYRELFSNKAFIRNPAQLGVLSQWNASGLEQVETWGSFPRYDDAVVLRPSSVGLIEAGGSFKLGPNDTALLRERINFKALEMKMGK